MNKNIRFTLDTASIDNAINELNNYKLWLEKKAIELKEEIGQLISNYTEGNLVGVRSNENLKTGEYDTPVIDVSVSDEGDSVVVTITGDQVAFVEFGAGIIFNGSAGSSPNPYGADKGLTIGSYGYGMGKLPYWTYDGRVTNGTEAYMPLTNAFLEVYSDLYDIGRRVFSR